MPFPAKIHPARATRLGLDAAEWRGFACALLGVLGMALLAALLTA